MKYEDQRSTSLAVDNLGGATILGRIIRVDHSRYKPEEGKIVDEIAHSNQGEKAKNEENDGEGYKKRRKHDGVSGGGNGRRMRISPRVVFKEELELRKLIQEQDEEDPMKEYLIRQKKEDAEKAYEKSRKEKKLSKHRYKSERDRKSKHTHRSHRHRSQSRESSRRRSQSTDRRQSTKSLGEMDRNRDKGRQERMDDKNRARDKDVRRGGHAKEKMVVGVEMRKGYEQ